MTQRIKQEEIDAAGGDWGGYGELSGDELMDVLLNHTSIVLADKGLVISIERADGQIGTYNLEHVPNFS